MKVFKKKIVAIFFGGSMVLGCCHYGTLQPEYSAMPLRKSELNSNTSNISPVDQFGCEVRQDTPYYKDGPQQARPADGIFKTRTKLSVLKDAGSYALVESPDKIRGYVAISDIEGFALGLCKISRK